MNGFYKYRRSLGMGVASVFQADSCLLLNKSLRHVFGFVLTGASIMVYGNLYA